MDKNTVIQTNKSILQDFQDYLVEAEKSRLTIEKYLRDVGHFFAWWAQVNQDTMEICQISKRVILNYKAYLVENYATASVNSMLSSLNCFMKFIGRSDCVVKTLKLQRSVFCAEERELSRDEYKRLLQAAKDDKRLALLMQTICATGIRVSEHKYITVEAVRKGKANVNCKGKVRTVLLPQKLCRALLEYARKQHIIKGSVFLSKKGKPLDRSQIWAQMKRLCEEAKVIAEKVFPHNLRHLFARTFYSIEKDVVRLADILGHASVNTTRIYTQESGRVHRRQIEKMPLLYIT